MTATLIQAPAAGRKTSARIERIRAFQESEPLAPVRVVVPDVIHVGSFRRALAQAGGALGVHSGTFDDLYAALLGQVRAPGPLAPDPRSRPPIGAAHDDSSCGAPWWAANHARPERFAEGCAMLARPKAGSWVVQLPH